MREASRLTPMFRQYHALKQEHPRAILLFRMGDFYEMFFDDAKVASRILELTLTARGKGTDHVVPMCGFPHHQLDSYTARLVAAGQRVAICDQVEDPRKTKGLVRREVVRMVTPGTVTDPGQLDARTNQWVASVASSRGTLGAAFLDVTTGEFLAWQSGPDEEPWPALGDRLRSFGPREVVHAEALAWHDGFVETHLDGVVLSETDAWTFAADEATRVLEQQFEVASIRGFGLEERPAALAAAGGLLQYVRDTQKCGLEQLEPPRLHDPGEFLLLDPATTRNLEIERSLRDGGRRGSLIDAVDETVTAGGARLLHRWLLAPLLDVDAIVARQETVAELVARPDLRQRAREQLEGVHDIERLLTRAVHGTANPRDLYALRASLDRVPELVTDLAELGSPLARRILDGVDPCEDLAGRLRAALVDEPPATLRDGGVIRDGFDADLDELRTIQRDGKSWISNLEAREREQTGISSLKVRFNKVFGYFIEVSKTNLHLVPESYHRKQTIANGERFITPELKDYETKVLNAQERIEELELERFQALRAEVATEAARLKAIAAATARIDVLASLAELATTRGYCRPEVHDGSRLAIVGARHPVVERSLAAGRFVPNDTALEAGGRAIAVLTGPNMGGKSTYLWQVALIALLAQTGSFVPAESAEIGLVDRVFCRVGASDSLAEGQSTFMVEMTETANILLHATPRSLLLLDEIGRGTSTFDGLSIAWAVVEHLDRVAGGAPRTLFATHYHELTELAVEASSVRNLRMAVRESGGGVVFLHRVEEGASDRSYGIHVARLAGVPRPVIERAQQILANLERDEYGRDGLPRRARGDAPVGKSAGQPTLFGLFDGGTDSTPGDETAREVMAEVRRQDTDRLTPLDALQLLADWKRRLDEEPIP